MCLVVVNGNAINYLQYVYILLEESDLGAEDIHHVQNNA